ncbi:MAG: helix-turn-helix transcriptional regulator [Defluviitaleaceae bacterium]|nr:helix-turn-helix transcriptional regulator [Defluviitaleaceae bacterium]
MSKQFMIVLDEILKEKDMSRYELAKRADIQYQALTRYYKNKVGRYDKETLLKICLALECEIGDILKIRERQDSACQESD